MQLSSPAIVPPPPFLPQLAPKAPRPRAPFIALLPGGAVVTGEDRAVCIGAARVAVAAGVATAAVVGGQVWVITQGGALRRYGADGAELGAPLPLGELTGDLTIATGRSTSPARVALLESDRYCAVIRERPHGTREEDSTCAVEELGHRMADRRVLVGTRAGARRGAAIRLDKAELVLPPDLAASRIGASAVILDGSTLLVELVGRHGSTVVLYNLRNLAAVTRIRIGESRVVAVAERAGLAVLARGPHVALLDMRAGRCTAERILTSPVAACAIDEAGAAVAILDAAGRVIRLGRALTDVDGAPAVEAGALADVDADTVDGSHADVDADTVEGSHADVEAGFATDADTVDGSHADVEAGALATDADTVGAHADTTDALATDAGVDASAARDARVAGDGVADAAGDAGEANGAFGRCEHLHALGAPRAEPIAGEALAAYLTVAHAWIEAVCGSAIAAKRGDAAMVASARERERAAAERYSGWNRRGAPHIEIAHELELSPMAATLLLVIGAPQIWCELAREYAAVAGGEVARPLVDELLVATLLGAGIDEQSALACELDADAPLVRTGAVVVAPGVRPYAALSVHPALARRLGGIAIDPPAPCTVDFAEFVGPRAAAVALAETLVEPREAHPRIALRGKSGSGRRTLAGMLAARAGRDVDTVAVTGPDLAQRLRDVALRGHIPVVDLEGLPGDDDARRAAVRGVLAAHAGPLFVRAERDTDVPFTPTESLDFPALDETERAACWRAHLASGASSGVGPVASSGVGPRADDLAARYAIGPGAIARAAAAPDPIAALRASRGHRVARLAERVSRLASWDDLVVTADVGEALQELVARVRFRRTVLETWGMGDVATTARGVTALFQGGPGTGKTMAAGVIARALGYELWRVDLSKVVSKWIGETERNLAMLFDAAEEGEIVLLFDEADALFTKRTEVKSSNDKHANAATNYLLQRLDSFTGIAILTTNFGTAIDSAFRRRLAVHVEFPFPDEQERLRLWRAHLPRALPTRGDLALSELAATYQLSGGYIRNAALRAAYLAAGRSSAPAITADDLRRAIALEKERAGKLGNGRIE